MLYTRSHVLHLVNTPKAHVTRVTVIEGAPFDLVQRRLLEKQRINRLEEARLYTVLKCDDGLEIQVL